MIVLATLAFACAASCWAASAQAQGTYVVELCNPTASTGDGITDGPFQGSTGTLFYVNCGPGNPEAIRMSTPGGPVHGGHLWRVNAPAGTKIRAFEYEPVISHSEPSFLEWGIGVDNTVLQHYFDDGGHLPPTQAPTGFSTNASSVFGYVECPFTTTCPTHVFEVSIRRLSLLIEDQSLPNVPRPAAPAGPVRGKIHIPFGATDTGGGVLGVQLVINGTEEPRVEPETTRCLTPYHYLVPCPENFESSAPLDTTELPDGTYEIAFKVTDAGRLTFTSAATRFTVHNAPSVVKRPFITGSTTVGGQMSVDTGSWEGEPSGFAYQWNRCPASVRPEGDTAGCTLISGATASHYTTTSQDIGKRLLVLVETANAAGPGAAFSSTSDVIAALPNPAPPGGGSSGGGGSGAKNSGPQLTNIRLSHKTFPAARASSRSPRGTLLSFTSNRAGQLTIAIAKVRGKKRKPKGVVKLAATIKAGRSSVPLSSRIGTRVLKPGSYQVTITVRDAKGNLSDPARVKFTITRPRGKR